ncbi:MAG: sulfurtransferase [Chloroflexota bacterium]
MDRWPWRAAPLSRRRFCAHALAGLTVGLAAAGCQGSEVFPIAAPATVFPIPGHGAAPWLVDASQLQGAIAQRDSSLLILDLSSLRRYRQGHIPGAVHAWWQDTIDPNYPVYGAVLAPDDNQRLRRELLEDLGITGQSFVVTYDDNRGRWAARMVWFLRFLGHDRVAALDGGLAAWLGAGGAIEQGENRPPRGPAPAITPRTGYYIGTEELVERRADPATLVLDVRTDEEAHDDVNDTLPLGRIPGSVPFPWTSTLRDEFGRLKPIPELQRLFAAAGVDRHRFVVVYARFGVEAAHTWFVLQLLGQRAVVYDRGWAEWATTPGLSIAPL